MISYSLIGLLIIAVRNFQRFFDCSFVSAFQPIFTLKLDKTEMLHKRPRNINFFLAISSAVSLRVLEVSE